MAIDWRMGIMPDVGGDIMKAFEAGQQKRKQEVAQNALAAYATDPNEQNLNALAPHNPGFVIEQRQAMQKQQQAGAEKQRADLLLMGKLLAHAKDPASYAQARQAAQMYGMDVSQVPEQYDPEYVGRTSILLNTILDKGPEALSTFGKIASDEGLQPGTPAYAKRVTDLVVADHNKTIPYTQGGGVAGYNPLTGTTNTIVAPNPGGITAGTPVGGSAPKDLPRVASPQDAMRLPPGSQFLMPDGRIGTVPGGAASNGSSGFLAKPPLRLGGGVMTSGKRTPEGNAAVGGVPDSWHVDGNAVDYDGPDLGALLSEAKQKFPGAKAFIHKGHVHVQDRRLNAPYYGKNGTIGAKR